MSGDEKKPRPIYALRALGKSDLPATVDLNGVTWRHEKTIKHDFFAVTGFYRADDGQRAVLKVGRTEKYAAIPMQWLGKWLCRRESRFYRALQDLPNVPTWLGYVGETGFMHAYVDGRPLEKGKPVPDGFFARLEELMHELHRRDIAYADTNKPENILLGDDNLPYLIDFQLGWDLHELGKNYVTKRVLWRLAKEDLYHIRKHKRRIRPDELTEEEKQIGKERSWFIRLHRFVTKPYFVIRRKIFSRLRAQGRILNEGSK
jgi:predicted Ser/Thr protein kinase